MKKLLQTLIFGLICINSNAGSLTVSDPLVWSSSIKGTIESIETTISISGGYAIYDVSLTVSCKDNTSKDKLEVVCNFNLPNEASILKASLLIDKIWKPSELLERGLATTTYESVVSRRRDPLLLIKNSDGDFTFKIYPMYNTDSRSMKFSYMIPIHFFGTRTSINIDNQFALMSSQKPKKNDVILIGNNTIKQLTNNVGLTFQQNSSNYTCDLQSLTDQTLNVDVIGTESKDYTLSTVNHENENYFSINVSPELLFKNSKNGRKYIFMLERESSAKNYYYYVKDSILTYYSYTDYTGTVHDYSYYNYIQKDSAVSNVSLLTEYKKLLNEVLTENDSICFIYPDKNSKVIKTPFLLATNSNINNNINNKNIGTCNYDNLFRELYSITNLKNSENAKVVFISNNTKYQYNTIGDSLAKKIDSLSNHKIKPLILSVENPGYNYNYGSNNFFNTLASLSKGIVVSCSPINYVSSKKVVDYLLYDRNDSINNISIRLESDNGVIYNEYSNNNNLINEHKTILLAGKYSKANNFKLNIVVDSKDSLYVYQYAIPNNQKGNDSNVYTQWSSLRLMDLEKDFEHQKQMLGNEYYYYYYYTNYYFSPEYIELRQDIINISLKASILSSQTAFLSLDTGMVINGCKDCAENQNNQINSRNMFFAMVLSSKNIDENQTLLAYPNPFSESTKITIPQEVLSEDETIIQITNSIGQIIKTINSNQTTVIWDGTDNNGTKVASGIYFISIKTKNKVKNIRVLKM